MQNDLDPKGLSVAEAMAQLAGVVEAESRRNAQRNEMLSTLIVNLEKSEPTAELAMLMRDYVRAERPKLSAVPDGEGELAMACVKCNSPRAVDPCPKCGTALTNPADGWEWPTLPDIDRIRELAREVGYAIGVHGSLERDLDLIAAPWTDEAVGPMELAEHIAFGLGGNVVDFERQDKPCGRWACNIHTPDWTKMIDLSVMPPASRLSQAELTNKEREWMRHYETTLNRRAAVEQALFDVANGKRGPLSPEECRELALKLGVNS